MRLFRLVAPIVSVFFAVSGLAAGVSHAQETAKKEWTVLVFLNGNNNLDRYGAFNINQMEKVGSNDKINIVVQWASEANGKVQRLLVQKDSDATRVTSPIVEDMGKVDMGDYRNLTEFVRWGAEKYPAQHYFVDVWNHGAGWHLASKAGARSFKPTDISWDDISGNFMTTAQFAQAMTDAAKLIGQKIDIVGMDACLMAMIEVANQLKDSTNYLVSSEETEPAAGWPYDDWLNKVNSLEKLDAAGVSKALVETYTASYSGGQNGTSAVTLSAFDLKHVEVMNDAIQTLGKKIRGMTLADKKKVYKAADQTISFAYSDYGDLGDFVNLLEKSAQEAEVADAELLSSCSDVTAAIGKFVIANAVSPRYAKAKGVSIWLPTSKYTYNSYTEKYKSLDFTSRTQWGETLDTILKEGASE